MNRVNCQNCGGKVDVPAGYGRAKIRCPECGYYAAVPEELRGSGESPEPAEPPVARPAVVRPDPPAAVPSSKAKPSADPRDSRPNFESDKPAGPPLLAGTQEESDDDVQPYAVPGVGTKPCPHCRGDLPLDATLCVHCGLELSTGTRARQRSYQPIDRLWEEGFPLKLRWQIFAVAQGINVLLMLISFAAEGWACVGIANLILQAGLQAFVVGTFDSLQVRRTGQGKTTIHRIRRIGFYPVPPIKIPWKKSQAVAITATHGAGIVAWMVCLYLATLCLVPGVIFYLMVIRPERFAVRLCDVYGSTDAVAFVATSRDDAEEIARTINDATGLMWKPV